MNNTNDFIKIYALDGSANLTFKKYHNNLEIFYSNIEGEEINKSISSDDLIDFTLDENIEGIIDYTLKEELNINLTTFSPTELKDSLKEILSQYSKD